MRTSDWSNERGVFDTVSDFTEAKSSKLAAALQKQYSRSWMTCEGCNCNLLNPQNSGVPMIVIVACGCGALEIAVSVDPSNMPKSCIKFVVDRLRDRYGGDDRSLTQSDPTDVLGSELTVSDIVDLIDIENVQRLIMGATEERFGNTKNVPASETTLNQASGDVVLCPSCWQGGTWTGDD